MVLIVKWSDLVARASSTIAWAADGILVKARLIVFPLRLVGVPGRINCTMLNQSPISYKKRQLKFNVCHTWNLSCIDIPAFPVTGWLSQYQ